MSRGMDSDGYDGLSDDGDNVQNMALAMESNNDLAEHPSVNEFNSETESMVQLTLNNIEEDANETTRQPAGSGSHTGPEDGVIRATCRACGKTSGTVNAWDLAKINEMKSKFATQKSALLNNFLFPNRVNPNFDAPDLSCYCGRDVFIWNPVSQIPAAAGAFVCPRCNQESKLSLDEWNEPRTIHGLKRSMLLLACRYALSIITRRLLLDHAD
jgi:hypothetical protein